MQRLVQGRPAKLICLMNDPGPLVPQLQWLPSHFPFRPPVRTSTPGAASVEEDHPPGGRWRGGGFIHRYPVPVRGSQEVQPDSEGQLGCLTWRENTLGTFTRKHSSQHKQTHKLNGICVLGSSPSSDSVARYGRKHFGVGAV